MPKAKRRAKKRHTNRPAPRNSVPLDKRLFPVHMQNYTCKLCNCTVIAPPLCSNPVPDVLTTQYPELDIVQKSRNTIQIRSPNNGSLLLLNRKTVVVNGISVEDPPYWKAIIELWLNNFATNTGIVSLPEDWYRPFSRIYTGNLGNAVNLGKFAALHQSISNYKPQSFPGCSIRANNAEDTKLIVFSDGQFNIICQSACDFESLEALLDELSSCTDYANERLKSEDENLADLFKERLQLDPDFAPDLTVAMSDLTLNESKSGSFLTVMERIEEYNYWLEWVRTRSCE